MSLRFINGMETGLNVSSGDDVDFGYLEQFSVSNYTAVRGGRYDSICLFVRIILNVYGIVSFWFYTLAFFSVSFRIHFTIKGPGEGMLCEFHREFGFGSSFVYFIPANFSFGENVSTN